MKTEFRGKQMHSTKAANQEEGTPGSLLSSSLQSSILWNNRKGTSGASAERKENFDGDL